MQSNGLKSHEILPSWKSRRKREYHAAQILRGPRDGRSTVGDSTDLVDLEPNCPRTVERGDITIGSLCHVNINHTRMVDRVVASDTELCASGDGDRRSGRLRLRVIATQIEASNVCYLELKGVRYRSQGDTRERKYRGLALIIVRLTNVHPLRSGCAPNNEGGESIFK